MVSANCHLISSISYLLKPDIRFQLNQHMQKIFLNFVLQQKVPFKGM